MNSLCPTLSFCITCKNRLSQIKETLPRNIADNKHDKDKVEFVLVDFGSEDGLPEWIFKNFKLEIQEGFLKYYYTDELPYWHASIAKNTAHRLASHDIVVNLDCDNFTGFKGAKFLLDKFEKYGPYRTYHQFSNDFGDGTFGRIALTKKNFLSLGGYDERFEPMGHQDADLLLRAAISGFTLVYLVDSRYNRAIPNSKEDGVRYVDSTLTWGEMQQKNFHLSYENITHGKITANTEKGYIGIVDNIFTFDL